MMDTQNTPNNGPGFAPLVSLMRPDARAKHEAIYAIETAREKVHGLRGLVQAGLERDEFAFGLMVLFDDLANQLKEATDKTK